MSGVTRYDRTTPQPAHGIIRVKMPGKLRHEDFNNMLPLIEAAVASQGKWVLGVNLTGVLALLSGGHPVNDGTGQGLHHLRSPRSQNLWQRG